MLRSESQNGDEMKAPTRWTVEVTYDWDKHDPIRIYPFRAHPRANEKATVRDMLWMLKALPKKYLDYEFAYDSACGSCWIRNFEIYERKKAISVNG